jgi:hypothetical protein
MAPNVYDGSRESDSDSLERKVFLVRLAGNRAGDLLLMRRVWYHKTTASALMIILAAEYIEPRTCLVFGI